MIYNRDSAEHAEYMVLWRAKNRERAREISRAASAKYCVTHPELRKTQAIKYNDKLRAYIAEFFGGKCSRCGFDDPRALQMDHINGGGGQERKNGKDTLWQRYVFIKDHPDEARQKYQLLCANCNCIKRVENQEYRNGYSAPRDE